MVWSNGPLVVFHGTDAGSASAIRNNGIDPSLFRSKTDFGAGFYVTTVRHQAEQWANQRCRKIGAAKAEVLAYSVLRSTMEHLRHLAFVLDDDDDYEFVAFCRQGGRNHGPPPRRTQYHVVYGPVSLWSQKLVVAGCDQIMFTDPTGAPEFKRPEHSIVPPANQSFF